MAGNVARENNLGTGKGAWLKIMTFSGVVFLMTPLLILVIFSFNSSRTVTHWTGFSLQWYRLVFSDQGLWIALRNSLIIAVISTALSVVISTMAALLLGKYKFKGRALLQNILYVPVIMPEIIFGVALLTLFLVIRFPLGILSIICAHVTFIFPFATLVIFSKVITLPPSLEEASLDLGANRWQTFRHIVLPHILPGVITGALFAFTLSIDDFVVTFFTAGVGSSTLPLKIYAMIKYGITPSINALSTMLLLVTVAALFVADRIQKSSLISKTVKLSLAGFIGIILLLLIIVPFFLREHKQLNFYTYSSYIDETLLQEFEKETGIKVNVDYFSDNDQLLARLKMGVTGYDLIVPASYMVKMMRDEGLITPIDFRNIPNIRFINPEFRRFDYDSTGSWSVPYAFGYSAIVYNSEKIHDSVVSWNSLWNPAYSGKILMLDDMRETYFVAAKLIGKDDDDDTITLREAFSKLMVQKPLVMKYESDATEDIMVSGDAWIAQSWNGAIDRLCTSDPKFRLCLPREGSLFFIDNLCIPVQSQNKKNAELFINFLLLPEHSARNMNVIRYAMPNRAARELLDSSLRFNTVVFPNISDFSKIEVNYDLGLFNRKLDKAWTELKVH